MSQLFYVVSKDNSIVSPGQNFDEKSMSFTAIGSTHEMDPVAGKKIRSNLPVFINGKNENQLYVPVSEVPSHLKEIIESGKGVKVFLRNRREILASFNLMMKHSPNCLKLVEKN